MTRREVNTRGLGKRGRTVLAFVFVVGLIVIALIIVT